MKFSDFLQIKDAAKLIGVSTDTLRRWDKAGKISSFRHPMNNYRLYRLSDLQKIIRELTNDKVLCLYE